MASRPRAKPRMTPVAMAKADRAEIARAYTLINKVLQPLTLGDGGDHRGEGGDPKVVDARFAFGALQLLRQHALRGVK